MKIRPLLGTFAAPFRPRVPFYAHFFVTERCNCRCSYCDVWREPAPELDTAGERKVIQRIRDLGVSCLSFTGGEPLLRDDLGELLDFSSDLGMHTRVTSNGLAPRKAYRHLLESRADAFSISIDGVGKTETPYRKVDPKNRETILFLAENRGRKHMGLSCVLHSANAGQVRELVEWVAVKVPGIRIFIQPVVTGPGKFRRQDEEKLRTVEVLFSLAREYPAVVDNLDFFNRAAAEAAGRDRFAWGCRAGRQYFSVKSDGGFWICLDIPTRLNILDPEFEKKWRAFDPQPLIAACPGCTYSCYLQMQKGLEPRNWFAGLAKLAQQHLHAFDARRNR